MASFEDDNEQDYTYYQGQSPHHPSSPPPTTSFSLPSNTMFPPRQNHNSFHSPECSPKPPSMFPPSISPNSFSPPSENPMVQNLIMLCQQQSTDKQALLEQLYLQRDEIQELRSGQNPPPPPEYNSAFLESVTQLTSKYETLFSQLATKDQIITDLQEQITQLDTKVIHLTTLTPPPPPSIEDTPEYCDLLEDLSDFKEALTERDIGLQESYKEINDLEESTQILKDQNHTLQQQLDILQIMHNKSIFSPTPSSEPLETLQLRNEQLHLEVLFLRTQFQSFQDSVLPSPLPSSTRPLLLHQSNTSISNQTQCPPKYRQPPVKAHIKYPTYVRTNSSPLSPNTLPPLLPTPPPSQLLPTRLVPQPYSKSRTQMSRVGKQPLSPPPSPLLPFRREWIPFSSFK